MAVDWSEFNRKPTRKERAWYVRWKRYLSPSWYALEGLLFAVRERARRAPTDQPCETCSPAWVERYAEGQVPIERLMSALKRREAEDGISLHDVRTALDHFGAREIVKQLRKQAKCVYLATEASVADDIADCQTKAAAHIEQLEAVAEAAHFLLVWTHQHEIIDYPSLDERGWRISDLCPGTWNNLNSAEQNLWTALAALEKRDD